MEVFGVHTLMALCGFALGIAMGAIARGARFCTFGALEDYALSGRSQRIRSFALAIAVAIVLVQLMHHFGVARIEQTFYLAPILPWASAVIGGLLFGVGMSMAGTCGYGLLVRFGGGDLKAFVGVLILGLTAYMTARGLTGVVRVNTTDRLSLDMTAFGGQGLGHIVAALTGVPVSSLWLPLGLTVGGGLAYWCFKDAAFRAARRDIVAGCLIGATVAAGFAVTGILGNNPFNPQRVVSFAYVLPPGETIMWLATFSGAYANFAVGSVLGTIAGSFAIAVVRGELRWDGFDDGREMRRHLLGAFLMGVGGVTAMGCTIGQGISGMSTLSLMAPLALGSIVVGGLFGLHWLLTGSMREAVDAMMARDTE